MQMLDYNSSIVLDMKSDYLNGMTVSELTQKYGFPISAIRKALLGQGIIRTTRPYLYPPEKRKEMADFYVNNKVSLKDVAEKYNCSQTTIHSACIEFYGPDFKKVMNIPERRGIPKGFKKPNKEADVLRLYYDGLSNEAIGSQLNISIQTVKKHLLKNGITRRICKWCGKPVPKYKEQYCSDKCLSYSWKLREYGIDQAQYSELFAEQNGQCAICHSENGPLVIDHDHHSGKVRGLLCAKCNSAIGLLNDNPEYIQGALAYISGR